MKIEDINKSIVNLKVQILNLEKQLNQLVLESSGDSNAEVIQARNGENTLNDRITKIENNTEITNAIEDEFIKTLFEDV